MCYQTCRRLPSLLMHGSVRSLVWKNTPLRVDDFRCSHRRPHLLVCCGLQNRHRPTPSSLPGRGATNAVWLPGVLLVPLGACLLRRNPGQYHKASSGPATDCRVRLPDAQNTPSTAALPQDLVACPGAALRLLWLRLQQVQSWPGVITRRRRCVEAPAEEDLAEVAGGSMCLRRTGVLRLS